MPEQKDELSPEALMRWIVSSLYLDEAIPRGAVLQWYWQLLTGAKLTQQQLVGIIEATPGLYIDPPGCRRLNFRAVLEEPPPSFRGFVQDEDAGQVEDVVDLEVWEEIRNHLATGGWPKSTDSALRAVAVACWLQDQSDAISEVSFGRLLQLITICTHQEKLLGLRDGALVPYTDSEECERLLNAEAGKPTGVKSDEAYVKTWDELRDCLRQLVLSSPQNQIEVSQVKLQCRSKLGKELSETVFGHCSLSRLLDDDRLSEFVKCGDMQTRQITLAQVARPISLSGGQEMVNGKMHTDWQKRGWGWEAEDPFQDPSKDPWQTPDKGKAKGKQKGTHNILAKALSKGDKGAKTSSWKPAESAKGVDKVVTEAVITLENGLEATLKVYESEALSSAVRRFLKEQSLEEWYQTPLSAWLQEASNGQENIFLQLTGDLRTIVTPKPSSVPTVTPAGTPMQ
ncbi:unnamed protein product [Effrenium voratum]|uniref:Uncharacterized protein n=1 Tax=Effrenium voratum TaxID=2562239 RepID=A0AA36IFV6_9DINO|nr:unnamed protein product [Effrenium voratum]CAJ1425379.1 unnamed protein product [Effrenium voratum]